MHTIKQIAELTERLAAAANGTVCNDVTHDSLIGDSHLLIGHSASLKLRLFVS